MNKNYIPVFNSIGITKESEYTSEIKCFLQTIYDSREISNIQFKKEISLNVKSGRPYFIDLGVKSKGKFFHIHESKNLYEGIAKDQLMFYIIGMAFKNKLASKVIG